MIADEHGCSVDQAGYEREMDEQRKRSDVPGSGEVAVEGVFQAIAERVGATKFLGYEATAGKSKIVALVADGQEVDAVGPCRRCRGRHRRDAVLRRAGRPDWRHRRADVGWRQDDRATTASARSRRCGFTSARSQSGELRVGDAVDLAVDADAPRRHPAQPLGDAPPALGAAPRAGRARHPEGLAGRARPPALRLLALGAAVRRREAAASRTWSTSACARTSPPTPRCCRSARRSRRARSRSSARSTATACAS